MSSELIKRCSVSFIIREIQIKTQWDHFIPRITVIKDSNLCWLGCREVWTPTYTAGGKVEYTLKNSLAVPQKVKHRNTAHMCVYVVKRNENRFHVKTCTQLESGDNFYNSVNFH